MAQDEVILRGNSASLETALDRAVRAFERYYGNIERITNVSGKFDKSGRVLTGTITAITRNQQELNTRFRKTGQQWQILGEKLDTLSNKQLQYASLEKRIQLASQARLQQLAKVRAQKSKERQTQLATEAKSVMDVTRAEEARRRAEVAQAKSTGRIGAGVGRVREQRSLEIQKELNRARARENILLRQREAFDQRRALQQMRQMTAETRRANAASQGLLLSWQSIMRLLTIQIGYTAVFGLTNALREGVSQAIEFQRAVAGVRTISQEANMSAREWADGLQRVSDGWRLDILEQTEAAYQALTNQVVDGADAFRFLDSANRFATAAFVDTNEAVRLVTSAINAYGETAGDAEEIFASFFKTIELGRIRGGELTEIGRILLPARTIGVSLNEVNAAMATLSRQGVKANEAMTFLRNIMQQMVRPGKDMQEFLNDLGVDTAQQALEMNTFGEFLGILQDRFKGNASELGALFRRIRALGGIFGLQGRALETYNQTLEEITNSTGSYNKAVDLVIETSGNKLQVALSKVRNLFIRLGDEFLDAASKWTDGFNYVFIAGRELVRFVRYAAVPAIAGLTVVIAKLGIALLATPWGAIIAAVAALTAGVAALATMEERATDAARDFAKSQIDAFRETERVRLEESRKAQRELERERDREFRALLNIEAEKRIEYNKTANAQIEIASKAQDAAIKLADVALESIKDSVKETETRVQNLRDSIVSNLLRAAELSPNKNRTLFSWNLEEKRGQEALDFIQRRVETFRAQAAEAARRGDSEIFNDLESEILNLDELYKSTYENIVKTNERAEDQRLKLLQKGAETDRKYNEQRLDLIRKIDEAEKPRDRIEAQRELSRLTEEYNRDIQDIADASKQITTSRVEELNATERLKGTLENLQTLRVQMADQQAKMLEEQKAQLAEQKLIENQVENLVDTIKTVNLKDVFDKTTDPAGLKTVVDLQKQRLDELARLNEEEGLGLDIAGLRRSQAETQLALETKLAALGQKERQERLSGLKKEQDEVLRLAEEERQRLRDNLQALRESATFVPAALSRFTAAPDQGELARLMAFNRLLDQADTDKLKVLGLDVDPFSKENLRLAEQLRLVNQITSKLAGAETPDAINNAIGNVPEFLKATQNILAILDAAGFEEEFNRLNEVFKAVAFREREGGLLETTRGIQDLNSEINILLNSRISVQDEVVEKLKEEENILTRIKALNTSMTEFRPDRPIPAGNFSNYQAAADMVPNTGVNVGDININLNSSGNTQTDVQAFGRELRRGIRNKTVSLTP